MIRTSEEGMKLIYNSILSERRRERMEKLDLREIQDVVGGFKRVNKREKAIFDLGFYLGILRGSVLSYDEMVKEVKKNLQIIKGGEKNEKSGAS